MTSSLLRFRAALIVLCTFATILLIAPLDAVMAGLRITYLGRELSWNASSPQHRPLHYVLHEAGSRDVPGPEGEAALRRSFAAWENVPDTDIQFQEDTGRERSRIDWSADDIHLVYFDEDNTTGFFPGRSGIVALTPVQFLLEPDPATGELPIVDADIIFNGDDHRFSTDLTPGTFDIQSVATHEIGHFLGFDHSGVCGSTMFPYVRFAASHGRSLTEDDCGVARHAYPGSSPRTTGTVAGQVRRITGETISGVQVVALDDHGRVAGSVLSNGSGRFEIDLDPGDYTFYAEPLDGPVTGGNISSTFLIETDFASTYLGPVGSPRVVRVLASQILELGDFHMDFPHGLNATALGNGLPALVTRGQNAVEIQVSGQDLLGSLTLTVTGPGISYDSPTEVTNAGVTRRLRIDPQAPLGMRSIVIRDPWDRFTVLTGSLEVQEQEPRLIALTPDVGPQSGGTSVIVQGAYFTENSRLFWNGVELPVRYGSPELLELTTPPGSLGPVDLLLLREDGREARLNAAFHYAVQPVVTTMFPSVTQASGGTVVTLTGGPFTSSSAVHLDGMAVAQTTWVDERRLQFTVPPKMVGAYTVHVANPLAGEAFAPVPLTLVFSEDPTAASLFPRAGTTAGGEIVQISGTGFEPATEVWFGVDPFTGEGGARAQITALTATTLELTTPAHTSGRAAVLIRRSNGQVALFREGFTFGVTLAIGERFYGSLANGQEEDATALACLAGDEVTIEVRALRSGLLPSITFETSAHDVLATTDRNSARFDPMRTRGAGTRRVRLTLDTLPETGVYWIRIAAELGSSGNYRMSVRSRMAGSRTLKISSRRAPLAIGPSSAPILFEALPGTVVSGRLKLVASGAERLTLGSLSGPMGSLLSDPSVERRVHLSRNGRSIALQNVPLNELGAYVLAVRTVSGSPAAVYGKLSLKSPKPRRRVSE